MSNKRKCIKNCNTWNKPTKPLLRNLEIVRITTKENESMNMDMEKGGITMNITMKTLIFISKLPSLLELRATKHLEHSRRKKEIDIIITIIS